MVKFGRIKTGDILNGQFFTAAQRQTLKLKIPIVFRPAENVNRINRFLLEVANAGQVAADLAPKKTPNDIFNDISEMTNAAKKMQQATASLIGESESFDVLNSHFSYYAFKKLPAETLCLSELLARINSDLTTLRAGTQYTAKRVKPDKSIQTKKPAARYMTRMVVHAFKTEFNCLPPQASWFSKFMKIVGDYSGVPCGSGVVSEVVASYEDIKLKAWLSPVVR